MTFKTLQRCDIEVRLLRDMNRGFLPIERIDFRLYTGKSPEVKITDLNICK